MLKVESVTSTGVVPAGSCHSVAECCWAVPGSERPLGMLLTWLKANTCMYKGDKGSSACYLGQATGGEGGQQRGSLRGGKGKGRAFLLDDMTKKAILPPSHSKQAFTTCQAASSVPKTVVTPEEFEQINKLKVPRLALRNIQNQLLGPSPLQNTISLNLQWVEERSSDLHKYKQWLRLDIGTCITLDRPRPE